MNMNINQNINLNMNINNYNYNPINYILNKTSSQNFFPNQIEKKNIK